MRYGVLGASTTCCDCAVVGYWGVNKKSLGHNIGEKSRAFRQEGGRKAVNRAGNMCRKQYKMGNVMEGR
jgi:hypothetical protein